MPATNEQAPLYRRWNPTRLEDICGNDVAVGKCRTLIDKTVPSKRPGFYLFSGDTGTGKSTLVHILFKGFGCGDIRVFNSKDCGKMDCVTEFLNNDLPVPSLLSANRAFIFEEAHNITPAAQEMFMEPLEKGIPAHTYVAFVTNYPEKLTGGKGALRTRPFPITTIGITSAAMLPRLKYIAENEPLVLNDEEIENCAKYSNGSMRVAINNMERVAVLEGPELRDREIQSMKLECDSRISTDIAPGVRDLAISIESGSWDKVADVLRRLRENGDDPEGLRRGLLAWYSGTLISEKVFCRSKRPFAQTAIDALRDNYFNTGFPGLVGDLSHLVQL